MAERLESADAELQQKIPVTPAPRPHPKFLYGPPAKEYKYASYLAGWEHKIETASRVYFADETKQRNLTGDILLDVAINPDGTIVDVTIRRSSGQKNLDNAALRIVHLAAPFAPFPPDFLKDFSVLHITRTWQFLPDATLDIK
ncbi:MAG: energy transducer TonB [Gammaproteobacteria bacterium]|nr:energy transducer TonB [Gammaproteobacteria bacterium]